MISFVHIQDSKAGTPKKSPPGSGKGSAKKPVSPKGGRGTPSKSAGKPAVKGAAQKGRSAKLYFCGQIVQNESILARSNVASFRSRAFNALNRGILAKSGGKERWIPHKFPDPIG